VGWFTDLFKSKLCNTCVILSKALDQETQSSLRHINSLKDEIGFLRGREAELTDLLAKATHIQVLAETRHVERNNTEPIGGARTWPQMRSKLEAKYKKPNTPENEKDKYWREKIKEQEAQMPEVSFSKTEIEQMVEELK
jgi:hypothetical protein